MRQQSSQHSFTQDYMQDTKLVPLASAGMGNANNQEKMLLVNDFQAWLDQQLNIITGLEPSSQKERINGIMQTALSVDSRFQQGQTVNMTQLPFAPKATDSPSLAGVSPEIRQKLDQFNFSLAVKQERSNYVASAFGMFANSGVSSDVDRGLLVASAGAGGVTSQLQQVANKINTLKLKLPGENGRFSLATYGDFTSIVKILEQCQAMEIRSPDQVAYVLATAWHESRMGEWMTEGAWLSERSAAREGERRYGPTGSNPSRARQMGNTQNGDGSKYMGRGYVQLTWKNNYKYMSEKLRESGYKYTHNGVTYGDGRNGTQQIDLVTNYKHVNENKDLAARILVFGMDKGLYVQDGKGLDSYIPENQKATHGNFQNARKMVNGSDKKRLIADNAVTIASTLRTGDQWVKLFTKQG